jgi:hypothetical protein
MGITKERQISLWSKKRFPNVLEVKDKIHSYMKLRHEQYWNTI